ncbi:MAG: hypothetical protein JW889_00655 [Verrucomicrobia bacterium]|nr:hypothetical protein [Verrucomicrobiota bacterium]
MSHWHLCSSMRFVAVVLVTIFGVTLATPVGSQTLSVTGSSTGAPPLGGTVVLHFTAESSGEKVLDVEFRCSRPKFRIAASSQEAQQASYSCDLEGQVSVMPGKPSRIQVSFRKATLERRTESSSIRFDVEVGAVLVSGEEKIVLKTDTITLYVKAVFEPVE